MDGKYLTTAELAQRLRTSPETIRYWRHLGRGPQGFKPGRVVLYPLEDVEAWEVELREQQRNHTQPAA
ncbi:MAG: helix-turn-helix transcriptional regulator [Streptomycetales bacterium]